MGLGFGHGGGGCGMMEIRLANITDESAVLKMAHAFHQEDGHPLAMTGPQAIRSLLEGSPLGKIYLIQSGGQVAGYFALCFTMSLEFGGLVVILDDFYVQPESRGKGLGAQVIGRVEEMAREWKAVQIFLEVETANARAFAFYGKKGFSKRQRHMMDKQF
jgi:GNAT superfamily N-acetyltransferase